MIARRLPVYIGLLVTRVVEDLGCSNHGGVGGFWISYLTCFTMGINQGSISPTFLCAAFAHADPESIKRLMTWLSFLWFWAPRVQMLSLECWWNRCQFHQSTTSSFCASRSQKVKRYWQLDWILTLLGAKRVKAVRKYVGKIEPRTAFGAEPDRSYAIPWNLSSNFSRLSVSAETFSWTWQPCASSATRALSASFLSSVN